MSAVKSSSFTLSAELIAGRRHVDVGSVSFWVTYEHSSRFEQGTAEPRRATVDVLQRALETAGVEFIEENGGGPGVRLRKKGKRK